MRRCFNRCKKYKVYTTKFTFCGINGLSFDIRLNICWQTYKLISTAMKFKDLKIRKQLGIAFTVAVVPLMFMSIVPIVKVGTLNDTAQNIVSKYSPMLHSAYFLLKMS